jgi:hypothetical protein
MIQCGGCWGFMKQKNTIHHKAGYLMHKVALKIRARNEI